MTDRPEAHSAADTLHRHGDPDPKAWDEAVAVTGRPQDEPQENTTFASRAKSAKKKAVSGDDAQTENKAVSSATTKAPSKKAAAKSSARKR